MICGLFVMLMLLSALMSVTAYAASDESAISAAKSAVVRILVIDSDGTTWTGSAFGIGEVGSEPQYFLTNAHVVLSESTSKPVKDIYILLDNTAAKLGAFAADESNVYYHLEHVNEAKTVKCQVIDQNNVGWYPDVAVIKAAKPIPNRTCLPLQESSDVLSDGQTVYALGFPGDMDYMTLTSDQYNAAIVAEPKDVSVSSGIVSQKNADGGDLFGGTKLIFHTASIGSGNSGGPLIDESGSVVGINTSSTTSSDYYASVQIDYALDVLKANNITYASAQKGSGINARSIVLISLIAVIIATAVLLILHVNKRKTDFVEHNELRIQFISGSMNGRRFPLVKSVSVGRGGNNNIVIPPGTEGVSTNHCVVRESGGTITITDMSTFGTFLNGENRLPKGQEITVKIGDIIYLGSMKEAFRITRKGGVY